jgi:hypothetical protein
MCLKYRMNTNPKNGLKNANSGKGFFLGLLNAAKNVTQKAKNAVTGNSKNKNKNSAPAAPPAAVPAPVAPASAGVNAPTNAPAANATAANATATPMKGGMAPVNFRYSANMQQPSDRVMNWATTAGVPAPSGPEMRNVAHGGKRRTHRRKSTHRRRSCGGRKRKTMKRKTHHKRASRHHKRRN